jgi:hypothetical protein
MQPSGACARGLLISSIVDLCGTHQYLAHNIVDLFAVEQLKQGTFVYSVSSSEAIGCLLPFGYAAKR